jgi:hypothetical protein
VEQSQLTACHCSAGDVQELRLGAPAEGRGGVRATWAQEGGVADRAIMVGSALAESIEGGHVVVYNITDL